MSLFNICSSALSVKFPKLTHPIETLVMCTEKALPMKDCTENVFMLQGEKHSSHSLSTFKITNIVQWKSNICTYPQRKLPQLMERFCNAITHHFNSMRNVKKLYTYLVNEYPHYIKRLRVKEIVLIRL